MRRIRGIVFRSLLAGCCVTAIGHAGMERLWAQGLDDAIPGGIPASSTRISFQTVATGLTSPNTLVEVPILDGGSPVLNDRLWIADQTGQVRVVREGALQATPLLDLGPSGQGLLVGLSPNYDERGLLGLAIHPEFATPGADGFGKFYTYTSEPVGDPADFTVPIGGESFNHQSVVREWTMDDVNADVFTGTSREILRIDEPQGNHNAGAMHFSPEDGYLYITLGDGGAADDQGAGHSPQGNGQDKSNILGSIIRIDPLGNNSANGQYGIPDDNPFVGQGGVVEEIFAYGLRNPFRFSFDSQTGDLLIADVGQRAIEEVNQIDPATQAGVNFGWPVKEGTFLFDQNGGDAGFVSADSPGDPATLNGDPVVDPVLQYDHDEGIAVIGGFTYHGSALPDLGGKYVFGELSRSFGSPEGRLFVGDLATGQIEELFVGPGGDELGLYLLGMGQDADGEIYVLASGNIGPNGSEGVVLKIVPEPSAMSIASLALAGLLAAFRRRRA